MRKFIQNQQWFHFPILRRLLQKGSGNIYVIAILGAIVAGSTVMVGGVVPQLEPPSDDAQAVQIDTDIEPSEKNNALELRSFGILPNTPIPTPAACETANIAILVDTSDSMAKLEGGVSRIDRLKSALNTFRANFKPETVVGLYRFGSDTSELFPFNTYGGNESALASAITQLTNGGTTRMSLGFQLVQEKIAAARAEFPNRKFFLVFMTDGLPEDGDCKYELTKDIYVRRDDVTRCTIDINGKTINATIANHMYNPTSIAVQMQNEGVSIFSIPLYEDNYYTKFGSREVFKLFQRITTNPDATYLIRSPTSVNLQAAFDKVATEICPDVPINPTNTP